VKSNPSLSELARVVFGRQEIADAKSARLVPRGTPIMGVMREFNRDSLGFIETRSTRIRRHRLDAVFSMCRRCFSIIRMRLSTWLATNAKNFIKSMSLRFEFLSAIGG